MIQITLLHFILLVYDFIGSFFPLSVTIPHYAAPLRSAAPLRDFLFNRGYGGSYSFQYLKQYA
ncbi:hypothetical protein [Chryseobacterium gambrini]|uniref:hypothetical protein n=1 Tax=Chryseobacterium gambrini TaxID=373672 RepID=UPI0022F40403|nr:hypothetical protein [Chryseobacterium gambrini]WBX97434.1 hypothetical protein PE065_21700 [Chryseobacterium gambrini]